MTTSPAEEHLDVRLVVHTHWDREWYRPVSQFRPRLVSLIDEILDRPSVAPVLLDGQSVVLEDYLEHRPERVADLSRALRSGDVEAGPWYVLADNLIPGGEGLVRNLLAGRQVLRNLRAEPPGVLYCPDSFGHPASLPLVAAGFGFAVVVLWRGYGGRSHPPGDTARWVAPDQSTVTIYHLPPDGYETGSHLPAEPASAGRRWGALRAVLSPRATTRLALLPAGADHHAVQANLTEALGVLAEAARPDIIVRTTLGRFAAELSGRAERVPLPTVSGELRDSYGYAWALQGTFGSRAALKRRYAIVERLLLRDAEPWAATAWLTDRVDRRHALRAAWRPLLLCQPHDTLCGCSVDQVARDMAARLDDAAAAAEELRAQSIMALMGHDANAARLRPADWQSVVLVRNAAPRARGGVAEIEVDLVLDDAPVGPNSAGIEPRARRRGAVAIGHEAVAVQELSRARTFAREEASRHYPWNRLVERRRVLAWLPEVPPLGVLALPVQERRRRAAPVESPVSAAGPAIAGNGLRVEVLGERVRVEGPDLVLDDWITIEAEGERGDLYTRSAIPGTRTTARLARVRPGLRGPLRATLATEWLATVPSRRLTSAAGEPRRRPAVRQRVQVTFQLDAGSPVVRILVRGTNAAPDARLRLGFRSGLSMPAVVADAAFGPVDRQAITTDSAARAREQPPPTAPLHRFVSLYDAGRGVTILSDGLAEYEASPDGMLWVTLVRAAGELSRHDLPERPGHAGYPAETPDAQCLGPYEAVLGLVLHGARSDAATAFIERCAEDFLLPLTGDTWRTAIAPPDTVRGPELEGDGLALSAVKPGDDGEWLVLRCVNGLLRPVEGAWRLAGIREARRSRLDETPGEPLEVRDGVVPFAASGREVVTILVR